MLGDQGLDIAFTQSRQIPFQDIETDYAACPYTSVPQIVSHEMHPGIAHHYVFHRIWIRCEHLVEDSIARLHILGIYECIFNLAVRIMLGYIIYEPRPSGDGRIRQPPLVPGDPYDMHFPHIPAVSEYVGTEIAALIHGHPEICQITVIFKFRVYIYIRYMLLRQFLGELQSLVPEHGGYDYPGRRRIQNPRTGILERVKIVLVIHLGTDAYTEPAGIFLSLVDPPLREFPEFTVVELRYDA